MSYYFVKVPKLPKEISHQDGMVKLVEYASKEGTLIVKGQTIAVLENWWARIALKAVGDGFLKKTFFDPYTHINEGSPLAIIDCETGSHLGGEETCELEILEHIRQKPK